ncbi:MAG: polysaccharide biosynthesis C-terminal domain-containing protein [Pseudomonadota bacterium]|nr:polysaccharide biosynthesis C-terminal domain-containing protein [Pseudomonadota bacterium]
MMPDRLGAQTVMTFGLKIWTATASFGVTWLIARQFGASGSGQFGIAVSTLTILAFIVLAGVDTTVVRIAAGDLREGNLAAARGVIAGGSRLVLIVAPLIVGLLWLLRERFAVDVLRQPGLAPMLGIMLWVTVPLALQRIASGALRVSGRIFASQLFDGPVATTLNVVVMAGLALSGHATLLRSATVYLAGISISCVLTWLVLRRLLAGWPTAIPHAVLPLVVAGLPILASNLSNMFTEWFTTVSLGAYWPAAIVGQYRAAWQFVAIAGLVQTAMDTILGPRIAAAARVGATDEIAAVARRALFLALALATPLFVVLIAFPSQLLSVFGPEFRQGALALQILAAGQLVRLASGPLGSILVMTGNQRWVLAYAGVGVALCVGLTTLLVPMYGAVGAAMATTATVVLRNLAAGFIVHRVLGINLFSTGTHPVD